MKLLNFNFLKNPCVKQNSLNTLSDHKKMFLINYLGDRFVDWPIDIPILERYPGIQQNIQGLQMDGFLLQKNGKFVLTEKGKAVRKQFRDQERKRKNEMIDKVLFFSMQERFLDAYYARMQYEKESIIPHGILTLTNEVCSQELPHNVKEYIKNAYKLDFSDCKNSEVLKNALRRFYVGAEITGGSRIQIPHDFEDKVGEYLNCPALDAQLQEKCTFLHPPRLMIYFNTKTTILNWLQTKIIDHWDGNFLLGVYDCTDSFHATMAQYENMKSEKIPDFPKTFLTFERHKKLNDDRYKSWVEKYKKQRKE